MSNQSENPVPNHQKIQIITEELLENFRKELISEIKQLLDERLGNQEPTTEWLSKKEAMNLMKIKSSTTLETLRKNGTLPYTKLGGKFLYNRESIQKLLKKVSYNG